MSNFDHIYLVCSNVLWNVLNRNLWEKRLESQLGGKEVGIDTCLNVSITSYKS